MKQLLSIILMLFYVTANTQDLPTFRMADKIRIKEAMTIASSYGDSLFEGLSKLPFTIILISDSTEFLIHHFNPSQDFKLLGRDEFLNADIYYRRARFNPHALATFPAVNGVSCIVVGTPENTNKNSSEWIVTLLHEHFHQYQNADPGYYTAVSNLKLSNGDETGMWMLNYPFPYEDVKILKQFELYTQALYKAVKSDAKQFPTSYKTYLSQRAKFKSMLSISDYRYFSLQLWQEGLARHTEYSFLTMMRNYMPSKEVLSLPDFVSFDSVKVSMYKNETQNLISSHLNELQRISFYSVGFAEGLLLDKKNKVWRNKYLVNKFYVEDLLIK